MPNVPSDDTAAQRKRLRSTAARRQSQAASEPPQDASHAESGNDPGKPNDDSGVHTSDPAKPPALTEQEWTEIRQKLIFYYTRRGYANAEDLVQEALLRLVKWLEHGELTGEAGFVKLAYGFARFVRMENIRVNQRVFLELPDVVPGSIAPPHDLNPVESARQLNQLLRHLSKRERDLLLKAETIPAEKLANEYGVLLSTLRVWLYRARTKLRELDHSFNNKKHG